MLCAQAGCLTAPSAPTDGSPAGGPRHSIQTLGNPFEGGGVDRVWIPAEQPNPAATIGEGSFTIELWIKVEADPVPVRSACLTPWWQNHVLLDREFAVDPPQNGNLGFAIYRTVSATGCRSASRWATSAR